MSEKQPPKIKIEELVGDSGRLTRMWLLQLIGQHNQPVTFNLLAETVVGHLETADPKSLRIDYTPHNSLDEVLSGMSGSGLVKKDGANGDTTVQLTSHGRRLLSFLPSGIPEALGVQPQPIQA